MGLLQEQIGTTYQIDKMQFALADLAASQTDTVIPTVGGIVNTHVAWGNGCIVGYTVQLSAAVSAGTLKSEIFVNDVDTGIDVIMDTALTTEFTKTFEYGQYSFNAGQTIGVKYTTNSGFLPTTDDALITVFVMYRDINL